MFECIDLSLFAHSGEDIPQLVRRRRGHGKCGRYGRCNSKDFAGTNKNHRCWANFFQSNGYDFFQHGDIMFGSTQRFIERKKSSRTTRPCWITTSLLAFSHPKKSIESSFDPAHIFQGMLEILSCANLELPMLPEFHGQRVTFVDSLSSCVFPKISRHED